MSLVIGGDGFASHDDCQESDAVPGFTAGAGDCWICGKPLDNP